MQQQEKPNGDDKRSHLLLQQQVSLDAPCASGTIQSSEAVSGKSNFAYVRFSVVPLLQRDV